METLRGLEDDFVEELDEILTWAECQGVTVNSRFHTYQKNIKWLRENDLEEDRSRVYSQIQSQGRLNEILSTMTESIELVQTIPVLRKHDVVIPREILKRVFSGPVDTSQENETSNRARNAMFELSVGAMAARSGLKAEFRSSNPDLTFGFESRLVKVECKRVLSENRIMERLADGVKQLKKTVKTATSDFGIVAISFSKLINSGDKFLLSSTPREELSKHIADFFKANERQLSKMHRPWVSAFLVHLSTAAFVPENGYTSTSAGTFFPLDLDDQPFLEKLAGALAI